MLLDALVSLVAPPLCWACGGRTPAGRPLCVGCRVRVCWLGPGRVTVGGVEAWAPVAYEGPAREIVRAHKYRGAEALANPMAAQIVAGAPAGLLEDAVLVPVPLHPARLRRRGFNQAERLAEAIAARTGLECHPCLRRGGDAAPQVGRPRAQRLEALRDSIVVVGPVPESAVVVDDVITTGGTLAACAGALRSAGTRSLAAVAYARTLGR